MKYYSKLIRTLVLTGITGICSVATLSPAQAAYTPPASNRIDFNFNYDWLFLKQNVSGGASATTYNETGWQQVSLPHTWNDDKFREWIFDSNATPADPLRPNGTYYGIAWYRKHFTLPTTYSGRKVYVEFQCIGRVGTFWVNGQPVVGPSYNPSPNYNESGVAPVGIDITPYVTFGTDNVIAVEVNNDENYQTLGYSGSPLPFGQPFNPNYGGLNRDVTLHICDNLHQTLPLYRNLGTQGIYVYPSNIDTLNKTAVLHVQSEVENNYATSQTATLEADVVDNAGNVVWTQTSAAQTVGVNQRVMFNLTSGTVSNLHFWDPTYPYLYTVYTIVRNGSGTVLDVQTAPLGIRTYVFNPTFGLEVNGHSIYLNGYAPRCSMEWPAVGTPVDWMNEYDFQLMKANNANFCRPMHKAPPKVQVEAADKFGVVMVVPAAYSENDQTDPLKWQQDLDDMRDVTIYYRNNPAFYSTKPVTVHPARSI